VIVLSASYRNLTTYVVEDSCNVRVVYSAVWVAAVNVGPQAGSSTQPCLGQLLGRTESMPGFGLARPDQQLTASSLSLFPSTRIVSRVVLRSKNAVAPLQCVQPVRASRCRQRGAHEQSGPVRRQRKAT
jgi:hypothetical protein